MLETPLYTRLRGLLSIDNHGPAALLARGAGATFLLKLFNVGAVFGTAVLLARVMSLRDFGIYAYASSWLVLLAVFASLGLESIVARNVAAYRQAGDWQRIHGVLRFAFAASAAASVMVLLAGAGIATAMHGDDHRTRAALWLALLALPLLAAITPATAAQAGLQRVGRAQLPLLLLLPSCFALLVVVTTLYSGGELQIFQVLTLYLCAAVIALCSAMLMLRRSLRQADAQAVAPIYEPRRWALGGLSLMLAGSMFLINSNADILMLGSLKNPEAAAVYKTAARGAELVGFVLAAINAPLAPLIARLHAAGEREQLQRVVTQASRLSFIAGACIAMALMLFGSTFLRIFGAEFVSGTTALNLLCLGQLALLSAGPAGFLLVMTGHEKQILSSTVLTALLNVALNALFIPRWGVEGAAAATAISSAVWALILFQSVRSNLRIDPSWYGATRSPSR